LLKADPSLQRRLSPYFAINLRDWLHQIKIDSPIGLLFKILAIVMLAVIM
jgi:hypothetical protein